MSDSFFDKIKDNINSELGYTADYLSGLLTPSEWTNRMSDDADSILRNLRSSVAGDVNSYIDGVFYDVRRLAKKTMYTPIDGIYGAVKDKATQLAKNAMNNAPEYFGGVIDKATSAAKSIVGFSTEARSKFGANPLVKYETPTIQSVVSSGVSVVSSLMPSTVSSVSKIFGSDLLDLSDDTDPLYMTNNIELYCKGILEDSGYIVDKMAGKSMSRELVFINRPIMEIDNSGPCRSFAFFTRPNCNLIIRDSDGVLQIVPEVGNYSDLHAMMMTDIELYSELCRDNCIKSNLFHLLNNYVKEIPPIRLAETDRDGIKNMYGTGIPVPGMPSMFNNVDIPVTFMDNGRGDISKLLYMLSSYKTYVGTEGFPMRPAYIKNKGIDYLMSLYIVTVDVNWEIIGFGVALGLMITEPPSHLIKHNIEGFGRNEMFEDFTVTFKCSSYRPFAPQYYDRFNIISGFTPANLVDTKGSSSVLFHNIRPEYGTSPSGKYPRSSVFDSSNGGWDKTGTIQDSTDRALSSFKEKISVIDTSNLLRNVQSDVLSINSVAGDMLLPDTFEMAAKAPGIYTAENTKEKTRRRFCLGFSW